MRFGTNIFMPFVVLGDPTYEQSIKIIKILIDNGAGSLELGFAFSDPIADGPTIQKANKRALDNEITISKSFGILKEIREYSQIPISLMLSFNLVYNYGVEEFYKRCNNLKIDAILCPDVPLEESEELVKFSREYNLNQVFIVSPTTTEERMKKISNVCSGYVYLVSLIGTTGTRNEINQMLPNLIKKTKTNFNLPIYVGFGISKPEHVTNVFNQGADGVICGSAICEIIESNLDNFEEMEKELGNFCSSMSKR
jgi:tryptophan synthase alpha chain